MQQDLTPKQQTSEAVRQAETILITTGQNPTVDQVTGVLALSAVLRKFGKKVSAVISDPMPPQVQFLDTAMVGRELGGLRDFIMHVDVSKGEVDRLRYEVQGGKLNVYVTPFQGGFAPGDVTFGYGDYHFDLAMVLGVPSKGRIDRVFADNQSLFSSIPVVNLDFHRSNENYGAVNLVEPMASSLCEILVALSESLQTGLIDADIATVMLAGLMSSTDRFTASHTTSKSMTVAAQLMAAGARQQAVVKGLYAAAPTAPAPSAPAAPAPAPATSAPQAQPTPRQDRPARSDRPQNDRNQGDQPQNDRRQGDRPQSDRNQPDRPQNDRNQGNRRDQDADRNRGRQDQPRNAAVQPDEDQLRTALRAAQAAGIQARAESAATQQAQLRQDTPQPLASEPQQAAQAPRQSVQQERPNEDMRQDRPAQTERPRFANDPNANTPLVPAPQSVEILEPIIQPGHIEMEHMDNAAPVVSQAPAAMPAMADFAAAAKVLSRDDHAQDAPRIERNDQNDDDQTVNPPRDRV